MRHYIYLILSTAKNKTISYVGYTNNIEKRFNGIPEYDTFHEYSEHPDLMYDAFHEYSKLPGFMKVKKYQKNEKKTITKKELCEKLGWDQNKPVVVVLATDLTDGVFDCSWSLFRDRLTWIRETLHEIKNVQNINYLIKPHPNEENDPIWYYRNVVTDTISEYKKTLLFAKNTEKPCQAFFCIFSISSGLIPRSFASFLSL